MKTNLELLLDAVKANPDEDTPRLVYADELEELGKEGRAKFIRYQIGNPLGGVPISYYGWIDPISFFDQSRLVYSEAEWNRICHSDTPWTIPLGWMNRGFIKGIRCDWQWWVKHGDGLIAEEWVPLVRLTDIPPFRSEPNGTPNSDVFFPDDPKGVRFSSFDVAGKNDGYWSKTLCELRWVGTTFEVPRYTTHYNQYRLARDELISSALEDAQRLHFEQVVANLNEQVVRRIAADHGVAWEDAPRRMNRIEMHTPTAILPRHMVCDCEVRRMTFDALWDGRAVREIDGLINRIELTPRRWSVGGNRYVSHDGVCPACRTVYFSVAMTNNTSSEPGTPFAPPWSGEVTREPK